MKKIALAVVASAATLGALPAVAATPVRPNLLTNGTFQSGNLSGWTLTENNVTSSTIVKSGSGDNITTSPNPDQNSGYFAYFTTDTGTSQLSQTVSLLAGHTYSVGYDYYADNYQNPTNVSWSLSVGGYQATTFTTATTPAQNWYTTNANITAVGNSSSQFSFLFTGGNGGLAKDLAVDRFYLIDTTPGAVPEPATWAMMIGGFGAIGFAMRRRKASVSFA